MFKRELIAELKAREYRPRAWADYVSGHLRLALRVAEERPAALRSVIAVGLVLFALLFAAALALSLLHSQDLGRRIFIASLLWLVLHCLWIVLHLGLLIDLAERPVLRLGLPNALTLFRGLSVPALVILGEAGEIGFVFGVYLAGALSDIADGTLARRFGPVTRLGVVMDPVVDIAWNTASIVALAEAGLVPAWAVALVVVRYGLLVTGSTWLYLRNTTIRIRATRFGKASGTVMSSAVLLVLLNKLVVPPPAAGAAQGLLDITIGFLLSGTILHVIALGVLNFREPERAREPVGRVVGHIGS